MRSLSVNFFFVMGEKRSRRKHTKKKTRTWESVNLHSRKIKSRDIVPLPKHVRGTDTAGVVQRQDRDRTETPFLTEVSFD